MLGGAAAAIAFTHPSRDGIQIAAGCSGATNDDEEWVEISASGASETWSLDGFHYWVGIPAGWSEDLPESLDDLPNTRLEVVDDDGDAIAGQLGFHKIRRQAVVLTWRADSELAAGSTLRSTLVFGPDEWQTREQTLTIADAGRALEFPAVQTDTWATETWTEGPAVSCHRSDECDTSLELRAGHDQGPRAPGLGPPMGRASELDERKHRAAPRAQRRILLPAGRHRFQQRHQREVT